MSGSRYNVLSDRERQPVKLYAMIIEWPDADDAFVVTVPDLPGCRTHGTTGEQAAGRGEEAIAAMIGTYAGDDLEPPKPHFSALRRDARYAAAT